MKLTADSRLAVNYDFNNWLDIAYDCSNPERVKPLPISRLVNEELWRLLQTAINPNTVNITNTAAKKQTPTSNYQPLKG